MHFTFPVQVSSTVCTRANGTMPITPLFSYTQQKMHRRFTAHIYIDDVVFYCDSPHDIALSRDSLSSLSFDSATSITLTSESLPHTLFSGWNTSCQPYAGNMEVEDDWPDAPALSYGSSSPRYDFNGEMAYNEAGALAPGYTRRQPNGEMAYNEAGALAPGYTQFTCVHK